MIDNNTHSDSQFGFSADYMKAINEYFTDSERDQLQKYLAQNPDFANSSFSYRDIVLPTKKLHAPVADIPRAPNRYLYPIFQNADYELSFRVVGFYLGKYNYLLRKEYHPGSFMHKLYHDEYRN